jgi:divalent metal cation (Fe/Co/Zn/Cd) transporter
VSSQQIQLVRKPSRSGERQKLVRRAKLLAWAGVGWHGVEATIAVGAGLAASSIALIGFGADSLIESAAGIILLWRFAAGRASSEDAERRAQKLIGVSFYVIAAYVGFEAVRSLLVGERPDASWVGIGLAAVTLVTMPPLAIAKARIGERLGSSATKSEGQQNMLCAYLSAALVVGRPRDRPAHSRRRRERGPRVLARRELLHRAGCRRRCGGRLRRRLL